MMFRKTMDTLTNVWGRRQGSRSTSRRRAAKRLLASERLETRAMLSGDGFRASVTAEDVAVDDVGNTYMVGSFRGTVDFDPGVGVMSLTSVGPRDAYLAKFDAAGTALWVRGISSTGAAGALAVDVDPAGTVVVGGQFAGTATLDVDTAATLTSAGGNDGFVAVYTDSGTYQWSEAFGGVRNDAVLDVAVDATTGVVAAGEVTTAAAFGDSQGFVAARTVDGTAIWDQNFAATWESSADAVALTAAGQVVVGGSFEGDLALSADGKTTLLGQGRQDGFVAVLDGSSGAATWGQTIGGAGEDAIRSVAVSDSGLIAIGGQMELPSGDPAVPVTTDHDHDDDDGHDRDDDHDGRGDDSEQGFVAVLTADGLTQWSQTVAAESNVRTVAIDSLGDVTIGGDFEGVLSLDPAVAGKTYHARGREQGFVMRLDSLGNAQWATPFDGGRTQVNGVALDSAGNTFVASTGGIFRGGYLTELDATGAVIRSDSFAATAASKWHRHDGDDGRDDQFEDDWDDDGPAKPLGLVGSTKTDLPLRIEFDDRDPLFLDEDDAEREKVRLSLEHRDSSPDTQPYDFSSLTQGQIALLQAWSSYAATPGSGSGDSSGGTDDTADDGTGHDDGVNDDDGGHDDGGSHDDDHGDGKDDDGGRHDDGHGQPGSTLPVSLDASGYAQLTGTVAGERDTKRFSFTATKSGVMTVALSPDASGMYPELEVDDAATGRELLELEPHERRGSTSGAFAVVAGRTYVLKVEAPSDWATVNFTVDLQLS